MVLVNMRHLLFSSLIFNSHYGHIYALYADRTQRLLWDSFLCSIKTVFFLFCALFSTMDFILLNTDTHTHKADSASFLMFTSMYIIKKPRVRAHTMQFHWRSFQSFRSGYSFSHFIQAQTFAYTSYTTHKLNEHHRNSYVKSHIYHHHSGIAFFFFLGLNVCFFTFSITLARSLFLYLALAFIFISSKLPQFGDYAAYKTALLCRISWNEKKSVTKRKYGYTWWIRPNVKTVSRMRFCQIFWRKEKRCICKMRLVIIYP